MIATDMTSSCGTSDEKLRWAFKMYDEDGSGKSYLSPFSNKQNKNSSKSKYIKGTIIASVRSVSSFRFVCSSPPPQLQIGGERGWELYVGGG